MKITNPNDIKLNMWISRCSHVDLHQITTEEYLSHVKLEFEDKDDPDFDIEMDAPSVWATEKEALIEIRSGWSDVIALNEIDKRLGEGL